MKNVADKQRQQAAKEANLQEKKGIIKIILIIIFAGNQAKTIEDLTH